MTKLRSWSESTSWSMALTSLAFFKISSLVKDNTEGLPGGYKTKWAFVVVGLFPSNLIYKPAKELCQSNSTVSESCGSHTS